MTFEPLLRQEPIIDFILKHDRGLIWADMGFGKTAATLYALEILHTLSPKAVLPALVIAPLRVVKTVWPVQIENWRFPFSYSVIAGTPKQREKALSKKADIYIINYENLTWLVAQKDMAWPFRTIIADESTKLKGFRLGGKRTRARTLGQVAFDSTYFFGLSGTPAPQGLLDLWGQAWFVDEGRRLGRTYTAFKNRWFYTPPGRKYDVFPFAHSREQIMQRLSDVVISLKAEDFFPLDKPVITNLFVDLPSPSQVLYKQIERNFFAEIQGSSITAQTMATKSIKCLQIANGVIRNDEGDWQALHEAKLEALDDIIEEKAGAPLLVVYHFRETLARLKKRYPQGRELGTSPRIIEQWNAGEIPLLFIHPQSAGHGLNLQDGGHNVVMLEHWWSLEHYQQVIERIGPLRQQTSGYKRPVFIYNIMAKSTIDERVVHARENKATVQEELRKVVSCTVPIETR
jgi:SNF2 family DNA or RNA helicase